jgi:cytochrome c1
MAGEDHSIVSLANPAVQSCWLCGTRLPAREMVADGGSACADLRWYCADTRRCTERWTSHWSPGIRPDYSHAAHSHGTVAAPSYSAAGGRSPSATGGAGHGASGGQNTGALGGQGSAGQGSAAPGGQNSGAFPGQGADALPRRGAVPDPRGRQLAGLTDY